MVMKIKEAIQQSRVNLGKEPKESDVCDNCGRYKTKHTRDQTENCIRALYLKA